MDKKLQQSLTRHLAINDEDGVKLSGPIQGLQQGGVVMQTQAMTEPVDTGYHRQGIGMLGTLNSALSGLVKL